MAAESCSDADRTSVWILKPPGDPALLISVRVWLTAVFVVRAVLGHPGSLKMMFSHGKLESFLQLPLLPQTFFEKDPFNLFQRVSAYAIAHVTSLPQNFNMFAEKKNWSLSLLI
jgi:hypothetical protein